MVAGYSPFAGDGSTATMTKLKAAAPGYRIYAFLETQTLMGLEGGMYKFI